MKSGRFAVFRLIHPERSNISVLTIGRLVKVVIPQIGPFYERLLLYIMFSALFTRVLFEVGLGMEPKVLNQQRQLMCYGMLALDYGWQFMNWRRIRITISRVNPIIPLLIVMILHGVVIGLWSSNSKSRILIDTANVVVVLFNLILLADPRSFRDFSFKRLEKWTYLFSVLMLMSGLVAMVVNSKSSPNLGSSVSTAVAMVILCVGLLIARNKNAHFYKFVAVGLIIGFTMSTWNRTTMAFLLLFLIIYVGRNIVVRPSRVMMIVLFALFGGVTAVTFIPADSKVAQRVSGLQNIDLSSRTGSIGERQAELDAIKVKIENMGLMGKIFGAGHGASYDVKYTWNWKRDYSNAHYGWALFYLRWGYLGYLYLILWVAFLLVASGRFILSSRPELLIVSLLALYTLGYVGTYAYFLFFIAGIPFILPPLRRSEIGGVELESDQQGLIPPLSNQEV